MNGCDGPVERVARAPHERVDRRVGQVDDVLGRPVVAIAGRIVDRALEVGVASRAEEVAFGPSARIGASNARSPSATSAKPASGSRPADPAAQLGGYLVVVGRRDEGAGQRQRGRRIMHRVTERLEDLARARDVEQRHVEPQIAGGSRCSANSSAVTTPKLPPPRSAHSSSGFSSSDARTIRPSQVTSSAARRLSRARPCLRSSRPEPRRA